MIIKRDESEVSVLGEVQKYKVSIDERNINHIVTILSSNLYSHPMSSFLRETISNAIDSHKEAGVDEPIIVTLTNTDIAIRDFGTGISPERFKQIYINIGSSTKRESNEYIGSFGLGRFSCLSVSDLANVTSFYNGKAYYYVMNKDIDQLHIDLLFEKDTDEQNGVEVKIPYTRDLNETDLECLLYIKNIYIEDKRSYSRLLIDAFNKRKIYTYDNFKVCNIGYSAFNKYGKAGVLVGDIWYPVDYPSIYSGTITNDWRKTFEVVCPCVEIGAVDVTPNREELLYSERTKAALREAYEKTIKELTDLWYKECHEEKKDFIEFMTSICDHYYNELKIGGVTVELSKNLSYMCKYKDFEQFTGDNLKRILRTFYNKRIAGLAVLDNGILRKGESWTKITLDTVFGYIRKDEPILAIPGMAGFSSKYIKGFLEEKYSKKSVFIMPQLKKPTIRSVKALMREHFGVAGISSDVDRKLFFKILRELSDLYKDKITITDIIKSEEYQKYKEENREVSTYKKNKTEYTFHIWSDRRADYKYTSTVERVISYIKGECRKARIVYAALDSPFIHPLSLFKYPNLWIIGVSKSVYKQAENGLFPKWIKPIESIYSPTDRHLCRYATINHLNKEGYTSFDYTYMIPEDIKNDFSYLRIMSSIYKTDYYGSYYDKSMLDIVPPENYDRQILDAYKRAEPYLKLNHKAMKTTGTSELFWYMVMKSRKIRLNIQDCMELIQKKVRPINEIVSKL